MRGWGGTNVCTGIEQLRICTWVEGDYAEGRAEIVSGCKERVNGQDTMRHRRGAAGPFMFTNRGEERREKGGEERSRKERRGEEKRGFGSIRVKTDFCLLR